MISKREITLLLLIILIGTIFASKYSSRFPIGTYSYMGNRNYVYDNREFFIDSMLDLGYNTNIMEVFSSGDSSVSDYSDVFTKMYNDGEVGLDAVIMDKRWDSSHYNSTYAYSTGSYQRFEAEYTSGEHVLEGDNLLSQYWYRSRSDTWAKRRGQVDPFDYRYWLCSAGDSTGYAYTDVKYRWNTAANDSIRIGKEFYLKQLATPDTQNYIYITYSFLLSNVPDTLPDATPLVAFIPEGFPYNTSGGHELFSNRLVHENEYNDNTGSVTTFTYDDYSNLLDPTDKIYVTIKISYAELNNKSLLAETDNWWKKKLVNLNPRLFWFGKCDLRLDYIDIEDQIFHDMKVVDGSGNIIMDPSVASAMTTQMGSIAPGYQDLISGFYTIDEPTQPLWESYRLVQQNTNATIMSAAYDQDYRKFPLSNATNKYYDHVDAFINVSTPKVIMPDMYPLRPQYTDWNSAGGTGQNLQNVIDDKVLRQYANAKGYAMADINRKFYPVVQSFGSWDKNQWISWMLPPTEMQNMLQLLPLCYQPDGIFNYRLFGYQSEQIGTSLVAGDYAPLLSIQSVYDIPTLPEGSEYDMRFGDDNLTRIGYEAPQVYSPTYNTIKDANRKLALYGPLLKSITWIGADPIMVEGYHPEISIGNMMLSGLSVQENTGEYDGYVQCGYYKDGDNPVFMLVNRRANYFNTANTYNHPTPNVVPVDHYSNCFPAANSQVVDFALSNGAYNEYGTYPILFDPYDNSKYYANNEVVSVTFGPGDGKLLQMCASLPEIVADSYTIKRKGILSGEIVLLEGGVVNVEAGTDLTIKKGSVIRVTSGASFTFRGSVTIEDSVSVMVEENGVASFINAVCKWGKDSALKVELGTLEINGSSFASTDTTAIRWSGISASNSSIVTLSNCTIADAFQNSITNSFLSATNTTFKVPANSYGLLIANDLDGFDTIITNTIDGKGFYGDCNTNSRGLCLGAMRNMAIIHNVRFHNLQFGLYKASSLGEPDSIAYCNFSGCIDGIKILSSDYNGRIENCVFNGNHTGIKLTAAIPYINNCSFVNNTVRGILSEYSIFTIGLENGIYNSNFNNNPIGLESRGSNHRLESCYFYSNLSALQNHGGSNLYLGNNANNVFRNQISNIQFSDTQPYEATIQLLQGHNDFYHQNSTSWDFAFDDNYYNFPLIPDHTIDASKNWFEEDKVVINDDAYSSNVIVNIFDPEANMPPPPYENDRLSVAMSHEAQGEYETACEEYAAILADPLDSELRYLPIAADGVFRYASMVTDPDWVTTEFFDEQAIQYEIDNPALSALLEEYLAKALILEKDYQAAIDLIQQRIDDPSNPIDSLLAVLDLEIVLQLSTLDDTKKPITTKYTQYRYPNVQVFNSKHDEHWAKLYELMNEGKDNTGIPIPSTPQIASNYPNPFNPSTTIAFSIPEPGAVKLTIYNLKGQQVKEILNGDLPKGHHKAIWDGKDSHNRSVSSGIYFIRLESGGKVNTRKAMLMK